MTVNEDVTDAESDREDADQTEVGDAATGTTDDCDGINAENAGEVEPAESLKRRVRRVLFRWPVITAILVVAITGVPAGLYLTQYRQDEQKGSAAAREALDAATQGSAAILSYAPESLDGDLAAAKPHLTGDFLNYYSKFVDQIVKPAAKQQAVKTTASIVRAAISEQHPDFAKVLVFLNQTTTSKDRPEPVQTESSVLVSLTKAKTGWLISAFDPL